MTKFKCEHHSKRIGIDLKNNNKPIYFPFCCHLWRARPPRLHFLSEWSFLLVLCPSWIMDYLSAITQCNHIQQCSSSCAVCFRDDASLNFLCAPSELSLPPLTCSYFPFCFLHHMLRPLWVFMTWNLHFKVKILLLWKSCCFVFQRSVLDAFEKSRLRGYRTPARSWGWDEGRGAVSSKVACLHPPFHHCNSRALGTQHIMF